jgi:hypothetical protein
MTVTADRGRMIAISVGMVGLVIGGLGLGNSVGSSPSQAATITLPGHTVVEHHTRVIKKVVRGRVVTLKSGSRVVRVPLVVIHNERCHPTRKHHCVRRVVVPAHTIPLRAAVVQSVAVATPLVPVTIVETVTDTQVVSVPVTVTNTTTATTTADPVTVTVTVSVPISPEGQS